ncbi:MAG: hypothetical protein AB7F59_12810 [Bdellovibrionales bacterium]
MSELFILTAFGAEYQALWQHLEKPTEVHSKKDHGFASVRGTIQSRSIHLSVTGMGPASCTRALETLKIPEGSRIFLIGFCGSLVSNLKVGDLFRPEKVVDVTSGKEFSLSEGQGIMASVENPVLSFEEKTKLASKFQAQAVDMEAAALLKWAHANKSPVEIIKFVMDDLSTQDYSRNGLKEGLKKASLVLSEYLEKWRLDLS